MQSIAGQRAEPDARLVQQIDALSARVEMLEKRLSSLSQCTVQQYWDGRLHLPAGRLIAAAGETRMTLEPTRFNVVVNGKVIVGSSVNAPSPPPAQAGQPLPGGAGWQSIAAASGIQDPRR